jgi:tRNA threonylcarbamoyladenosine biosynthesis protein TsaE
MRRIFHVSSHQRMKQLGACIAQASKPRDILFLMGEMGTGKTVFAKGFIRQLSLDDDLNVPSPTFLLGNTYVAQEANIRGTIVHHMDLFRLGNLSSSNLSRLGIPDLWDQNTISIIEWADKLKEYCEQTKAIKLEEFPVLEIEIKYNLEKYSLLIKEEEEDGEHNEERIVTLWSKHEQWKARIQKLEFD